MLSVRRGVDGIVGTLSRLCKPAVDICRPRRNNKYTGLLGLVGLVLWPVPSAARGPHQTYSAWLSA